MFEKRFQAPAELAGLVVRLHCEGIDPGARVFLNGERVGEHRGSFVPVEWTVTEFLRLGEENHLVIVVGPAPELDVLPGSASRERAWKSRGPYGWPEYLRLVCVGITGSVSLVVTGPAWFDRIGIYSNIARDQTEAALSLVCEFAAVQETRALIHTEILQESLPVGVVEDQVRIFGDTAVVQSITIKRVQLWWPNGSGRQPVYTARFSLVDHRGRLIDRREVRFGIRQLDPVRCEAAPPDSPPYCLEVNGRKSWLKGCEWVPADQFQIVAPSERLLRLARAAGINLLRVSAPGGQETASFYGLCDRFGLLVWQEFPLAGCAEDGIPPSDPVYLAAVGEQAEAMVTRRRTHPSFAIWSGGSGLTLGPPDFDPLGSEHPALAELRAAVETEDPQRIWLPVTPIEPSALPIQQGGRLRRSPDWGWRGLAEHAAQADAVESQLRVGFGAESLGHQDTLCAVFGDREPNLDPADPVWASYPSFAAHLEQLAAAFGPIGELEPAISASQLLQAIGLQYSIEAARRRQWRSAGVIPSQFNEPVLNGLGAAVVDNFGDPKPAYYALCRAYRPFHVTAALATFTWHGKPEFRADVWLHNDGPERGLLNVVATVVDLHGRELYQENVAAEAPENASENVGDLYWKFPADFAGAFLLFLEVIDEEGDTIGRNHYLLSRAPEPAFAPYLTAPETNLEVRAVEGGLEIENTGASVALGVTVLLGTALVEDSGFPLAPGACRRLAVTDLSEIRCVTAWNAPGVAPSVSEP